jgi:hypothetical protein
MKYILIFLALLPIQASQVPLSWLQESTTKNQEETQELEKSLLQILELQENILEKSESISRKSLDKSFSAWSLKGQKTDLAISKSGLFGFSAVKGASAVELSWSEKKAKQEVFQDSRSDIELDSLMSEQEVLAAVKPFYKVLLKNARSNEYSWRARNFEDHVLRYHRALKSVSQLDGGQFIADKFRLDLSFSYSSPLLGFSRLSGDTRVRLEWKISQTDKMKTRESDQKVVQNLLNDVSEALQGLEENDGYKLTTIGIGLGLSKKNLLSFSKVKGEIYGELFFKKRDSKSLILSKEDLSGEYEWRAENNNKFIKRFKRRKFRKGIAKSFKVSKWFTEKMSKRNSGAWEIKKFKSSFSLTYSGFLGLANTSSKSAVSFAFSK